MFQVGNGSVTHKLIIFRVYFFMFSVSPLPIGLDSTPAESPRNTNIAPLPTSLESTLVELLPLYAGSLSLLFPLFIYLKGLVNLNLFIFLVEKYPKLFIKEVVVPSQKHISTSDLCFLVYTFPLLHFYQLDKLENTKSKKLSICVRFLDYMWVHGQTKTLVMDRS